MSLSLIHIFSLCTGTAFAMTRIRAQRSKPGLMRQHLTAVNAAAKVGNAFVEGAALGATTLRFTPGPVTAGDYAFATGSAGSAMLVLQTVLPPLWRCDRPSRLRLEGGTHNPVSYTHLDVYKRQSLSRALHAPAHRRGTVG